AFDCGQLQKAKEDQPLFRLWARGSPSFLCSHHPHFEGDGAPTRRTAWIARPEVARLAAGPGREASRPAPCGAPTRHLRLTPQSAIRPPPDPFFPARFI